MVMMASAFILEQVFYRPRMNLFSVWALYLEAGGIGRTKGTTGHLAVLVHVVTCGRRRHVVWLVTFGTFVKAPSSLILPTSRLEGTSPVGENLCVW